MFGRGNTQLIACIFFHSPASLFCFLFYSRDSSVEMAAASRQRKSKQSKGSLSSKNDSGVSSKKNQGTWNLSYLLVLGVLALIVSGLHRAHVSNLFESDRHFSHLSTLERELAFRTEMGLYFSYFKTMITADSVPDGLHQIMRDNITEYPSTINTLKRFNLYPEVILGFAYRFYVTVSDLMGHQTKSCWTVNRGENLSPVQSCEGLGEPAYFYVEAVFLLNGLMMGTFFLFGTYLSDSIFGGLITVACYFYNHGECTRVQWTPPLRESFGYPFFILQMFLVTIVIKNHKSSLKYAFLIAFAQLAFMLSWQFAQFALLTQTLAVFGTYVLQFISSLTFRTILLGQTFVVLLDGYLAKLPHWTLRLVSQGVIFLVAALALKLIIGKLLQLEDDAHIGEIFKSKFTDFQNFHTMLYTCAKEFDFIEAETLKKLFQTLLIPSAAIALLMVTFRLLKAEVSSSSEEQSKGENGTSKYDSSKTNYQSKPNADLVYHSLQLLAFTAMALLIMRLKLFWTPHLCLYSALLASRQIFPLGSKSTHFAALIALLAVMGFYGVANIQHQRGIVGEFSNPAQEELVEWIKAKTPSDAVFAGAMPTMATVKLCTLRRIVNHPHYEDAGLRARTKLVYSMYSRKPVLEVKANLRSLGVEYAVLESSWCSRRSRPGCSMPEIWDLEDVQNRNASPACQLLSKKPEPHFKRVFRNNVYEVLKLT
ncbi:probable C-mannosyltransferase DPY19L1 isoform X2 [Aplysia californica]|uniref:Probable C-mannosyltransferase DPY19L1 isoform X2 n=1 Tax=Aplysia californica TaxID=6500 RepID=A0ABM1W1U9_APLCA|nr:probable C-mannosyltransferase DPY19L1 isoform X2 [Aplysia californica]